MQQYLRISFITAALFLVPILANASTQAKVTPTEQSETSDILTLWVEMSGQLNDRLLATVYWSLATVVGLVLLFVGFNWYANHQMYEKDRKGFEKAIRDELKL